MLVIKKFIGRYTNNIVYKEILTSKIRYLALLLFVMVVLYF
jgi:hypothetical protein